jgi:hypothetical protein
MPGLHAGAGRPTPTGRTPPAPMPRAHFETERIEVRPRRRWGGTLVVLMLLVVGAGAAAHFFFAPLDVLVTWPQPATLAVATEPAGAKIRLDGVELSGTTPMTVSVQRDRAEHIVDATQPGYRPARQVARYDRTVTLSVVLKMEKDPAAAPPAEAAEAGANPAGGNEKPADAPRAASAQ